MVCVRASVSSRRGYRIDRLRMYTPRSVKSCGPPSNGQKFTKSGSRTTWVRGSASRSVSGSAGVQDKPIGQCKHRVQSEPMVPSERPEIRYWRQPCATLNPLHLSERCPFSVPAATLLRRGTDSSEGTAARSHYPRGFGISNCFKRREGRGLVSTPWFFGLSP